MREEPSARRKAREVRGESFVGRAGDRQSGRAGRTKTFKYAIRGGRYLWGLARGDRRASRVQAGEWILGSIVYVDDRGCGSALVASQLGEASTEIARASSAMEAVRITRELLPDCILVNEHILQCGEGETLQVLREACAFTPIVVVTETPSVDSALEYTRCGAVDYVELTGNAARVAEALTRARAMRTEGGSASEEARGRAKAHTRIIGQSAIVEEMRDRLDRVARSHCNPILVHGETGTGKELAARTLHALGNQRDGQFVDVNCAALTSNLLESELFGHVRGAFTGAERSKRGLFELADGGTLFLEIGEMDLGLQAKLLRVLEERSFRKVGGVETIRTDARVIASTNRNLAKAVEEGAFRRDLYYRLNVLPIEMPPLRTRMEDMAVLSDHFLAAASRQAGRRFAGFTPEALARMQQHSWPGNVRELRNVIERAVILDGGDRIGVESLGIASTSVSSPVTDYSLEIDDYSLRTAERELILKVLTKTRWQKTKAAALLGITRATLYSKIAQYELARAEVPA